MIKAANETKKYRFFYHWNKHQKKWSVHYRGKCIVKQHLVCHNTAISKIRSRQPYAVMQGYSGRVQIIEPDTVVIGWEP